MIGRLIVLLIVLVLVTSCRTEGPVLPALPPAQVERTWCADLSYPPWVRCTDLLLEMRAWPHRAIPCVDDFNTCATLGEFRLWLKAHVGAVPVGRIPTINPPSKNVVEVTMIAGRPRPPQPPMTPMPGRYECMGTNPDGEAHALFLEIATHRQVYALEWTSDVGQIRARGLGLQRGTHLAVGFWYDAGGGQGGIGVGSYTKEDGGRLEGIWALADGAVLRETCAWRESLP